MSVTSASASNRSPGSSSKGGVARAHILAAATECFAKNGFHGTTTRDIASLVGMSPAAVYVHYASKQELLYMICVGGYDAMLAQVRQAVEASAAPVEQLRAVFRGFVIDQATAPARARVVNFEAGALSPENFVEIRRLQRAVAAHVRAVVEAGVAAGVFKTDNVRLTSLALTSLGIDVSRWYRPDGTWTPETVADHYAMLALRIVGVEPAAVAHLESS